MEVDREDLQMKKKRLMPWDADWDLYCLFIHFFFLQKSEQKAFALGYGPDPKYGYGNICTFLGPESTQLNVTVLKSKVQWWLWHI